MPRFWILRGNYVKQWYTNSTLTVAYKIYIKCIRISAGGDFLKPSLEYRLKYDRKYVLNVYPHLFYATRSTDNTQFQRWSRRVKKKNRISFSARYLKSKFLTTVTEILFDYETVQFSLQNVTFFFFFFLNRRGLKNKTIDDPLTTGDPRITITIIVIVQKRNSTGL